MDCVICDLTKTDEPGRLFESDHWLITLATDQAYPGRSYVTAKRHVPSLPDLKPVEWADLKSVITRFEAAVTAVLGAELYNWACLLNDTFKQDQPSPHVHWHVRPRLRNTIMVGGRTLSDPNFAHHYDRDIKLPVSDQERSDLAAIIKGYL